MSLKIDDPAKIKKLRRILDALHYDMVLKGLRGEEYFIQPWPAFEDMELKVKNLDAPFRACLNLFFLGKTLKVKEVEGWMEEEEIEDFQEIGLLERIEDGLKTAGYSIISYLGRYFVLNLPSHYPTSGGKVPIVYAGRDSYRLGENLWVGDGTSEVLDLCTGSGIIAILSAPFAKKVIGIEINREAVEVAKFNCILNNLEGKVEILRGDLYQPVSSHRFDIIYSNPPFVPVPPGLVYSLYGDGGVDGLRVIRKILENLDEHLHPGGRFLMVGDAIGDERVPFFVRIVEKLSIEKNWSAKVVLYGGEEEHLLLPIYFHKIAKYSIMPNTMNLRELISNWMEPYKEMGAEYVYSFTLSVIKASKPKVDLVRLHTLWGRKSVPILAEGVVLKPFPLMGGVYRGENFLFSVENEVFDFLKRCNGVATVEQIVNEIFDKYSLKYKEIGFYGALDSAIKWCEKLERKGILLRVEDGK